jgi:hypothetical protein
MQELRLTVKKRAFPSQGRVRLNIAHLPALGIREGERVDLVNETTKKSVTTAVIADNMVRQGQVRVSEEDLKTIGLLDDEDVLVRKAHPVQEKIKKAAADAGASIAKGAGKIEDAAKKTAGKVKTGAAKAAGSLKKEAASVSGTVGKEASKTAVREKKAVKKTVKKVTGTGEDR